MRKGLLALPVLLATATPTFAAAPVCDGTTDDTAALQAGLSNGLLELPGPATAGSSSCIFKQPLVAPALKGGTISGAGPYQTSLTYAGPSTTVDLLTIGDGTKTAQNWVLSNFRIGSHTKMTGGVALHLKSLQASSVENVVLDGQVGTGNLWNGVYADGADFVTWRGGQVYAQNEAVQVSASAHGAADFIMHQVKISNAAVGIHIGGGFGGFVCDEMDLGVNGQNIVIDNVLDPEANREIFIGPNCFSDLTTAGDGIYVNDPLANGGTLAIQGWVASAALAGIHIVQWHNGVVSVSGPTVFNNKGPGMQVDDGTILFGRSPATIFHANGGNCNVNWGGTCRP